MVDVGNFDWILQLISKLASSYCCFISSIQLSFLIVDPPAPKNMDRHVINNCMLHRSAKCIVMIQHLNVGHKYMQICLIVT